MSARNDQSEDDGFFIALKFKEGSLDTTDGRSGYRYKPGARMYPKRAPASAMRRRWLNEGYAPRLARLWIDADGNPQVAFCDQDDDIQPVCGYKSEHPRRWEKCVLDAGHDGTHSTTRTRTHYSVFR